jgi:hypothetical protein
VLGDDGPAAIVVATQSPSDAIGHAMPAYLGLRTADLIAVYAYLSAFPAAESCNTSRMAAPDFGAAAGSQNYVYPSTNDCPNPAPPQCGALTSDGAPSVRPDLREVGKSYQHLTVFRPTKL